MPAEPFDQEWLNVRGFRRRNRPCCVPHCGQDAVVSHLVASSHLKLIAENGHVVSPIRREHRLPSESASKIDTVGVKSAPVMTLYCSEHDYSLFSDLEKHKIVSDGLARALLHRTRHFELQKKLSFQEIGVISSARGLISGFLNADEAKVHRDAWAAGLNIAQKNADRADEILIGAEEVSVKQISVRLPSAICATGSISPFYDLSGKSLVPINFGKFEEYKALSLYAYPKDKWYTDLLFVWERDDEPSSRLVESIATAPQRELVAQLVAIIMWLTEDTFLRPSLFFGAPLEYQAELERLVSSVLSPFSKSSVQSIRVKRSRSPHNRKSIANTGQKKV